MIGKRIKEKISDNLDVEESTNDKKIIDSELPHVADGLVAEKKNWKKLKPWSKEGLPWRDRRKLKKKPEISFLIKMLFSNGTCKEFVISTSHETFTYKKRSYYLKYDDAYFNLTQNQFELTYFDDCSVPINKSIKYEGDKAFFSVTPENLKPLIDMNYVKVLASSADLDKYLKMNATLAVFSAFGVIILLLMVFRVGKMITEVCGG